MTPTVFVVLALAGGAGSACRLAFDGIVRAHTRGTMPWGTIALNLSGSFVLGLVTGFVAHRALPETVRLVVGTGFLGGWTTFSTASFESVRLLQERRWGAGMFNGPGVLAGATAAVDFIADLPGAGSAPEGSRRERLSHRQAAVHEHEEGLRARIEKGLADLPGLRVRSRAAVRTPTLLITFDDRDPVDAHRFLAERRVSAPSGSFYALEASRRLGLGDTGSLRVGLAPYVDDSDVDRLLDGLAGFLAS